MESKGRGVLGRPVKPDDDSGVVHPPIFATSASDTSKFA